MIKINCKNCPKHCCGEIKNLRPILIPSEEAKFKKNSDIIHTKFRKMLVLKRKTNGNCIFMNDKTRKCRIYSERPLECKIYPHLLYFKNRKPDVYLDKRYCSSLSTLKADKIKIRRCIEKFDYPVEWIKAHNTMDDY